VFWVSVGVLSPCLLTLEKKRRSGWEESTCGGRRCVGGRQGGGAQLAGMVVVGGRARSRAGASHQRLGEGGDSGLEVTYACGPRGSSGRLAGALPEPGGGGTWWAAEAARASNSDGLA
jgi:hypothetical protein